MQCSWQVFVTSWSFCLIPGQVDNTKLSVPCEEIACKVKILLIIMYIRVQKLLNLIDWQMVEQQFQPPPPMLPPSYFILSNKKHFDIACPIEGRTKPKTFWTLFWMFWYLFLAVTLYLTERCTYWFVHLHMLKLLNTMPIVPFQVLIVLGCSFLVFTVYVHLYMTHVKNIWLP